MTFSQKLAMYRSLTGLPQTALSSAMGISIPTYRSTESGGRQATPAEIRAFSLFSGLTLSMLEDDSQELPGVLPAIPKVNLTPRGRPAKPETSTNSFRGQQIATRIRQVITTHYEGNARLFASAIMLDETMLSGYLSGKREITDKLILKIVRAVPTLSADWLRVGAGSMFARVSSVAPVCHDGARLENYLNQHGLYWADLQRAMGLKSLTSASEYKSRGTIRHETRAKIAAALHVSVQDIFGC